METTIKQPFTNLQLELLKAFSHQLDDRELLEIRKMLATFFAQRAIEEANKVWDEKRWTDADIDRMLKTKMRTSKTRKNK